MFVRLFIFWIVYSCPSSSIPTYLTDWLTEWLMIHHSERSTRQCARIWSDNLQDRQTDWLVLIQRERRGNLRSYNLEEHDMNWWMAMTKFSSENSSALGKIEQTLPKKEDNISEFGKHHFYDLWVFIYLKWWSERPQSTSFRVKATFPFYSNDSNSWNHSNPLISIRGPRISITGWERESDFCPEWGQL